jgi:serine/threonine protein kinase
VKHSSEVYKIVKKRSDKSWGVMLREIRIMRDLEHKAVLPLLASFDVPLPDPTDLYLVFPYAELGDIESWIHQRTTPDFLLNESDGGTSYLFSVLELLYSGLAYLHGKSVLHFDLKPKNILLFVDRSESLEETQPSLANIYTWKIADFGNARLMDPNIESMPKMSVSNVTKEYAPPQWFDPKGYQAVLTKHGKEFDIWSMGCIALQLMTLACEGWESGAVEEFRTRRRGKSDAPLFHQHRDVVQDWIVRLREQEVRTTYGRQISNVVLDLINESLNWDDPDQRPLAWEIEMYMFDATSPNEIPRHKSHRYSKLSQIIPEANSNNAHEIKNRDPIAQASKRGKSDIVSILQEKSWYGKSLLYPNETPYESEVSPSEFFTNLPHSFNNRRLFGQKNILRNISGCFFRGNNSGDGGAKFVGIHGLGGVG